MNSYEIHSTEHKNFTYYCVTDSRLFVKLLNSYLNEGLSYLTTDQAAEGIPSGQDFLIGNSLLGSTSEFVIYVLCRESHGIHFPFINSFRAADPFAKGNFPLVDIRMFFCGERPKDDRLWLAEIKTTRDDPTYFKETINDFSSLYSKSRLYSTAEHLKYDLLNAGQSSLIPRVNDCLGTHEGDSNKIEIVPVGVSDLRCDREECVSILRGIVERLSTMGWPLVSAILCHVPELESTYLSFATGEGDK